MDLQVSVNVSFDDKAQNLLFGLYEAIGNLSGSKPVEQEQERKETELTPMTKAETKKVEKMFNLEEVRAVFIKKNKRENREALLNILKKRGVEKVSQLDPKDFAGVLKELEQLPNA